jgi:Putative prokaryotic signal transducing protein
MLANMKLLRASRTHGDLERIREVLQNAGIHGELLSGLAGDIPSSDSTPEVWLMDDGQYDQARQILAALLSEPVSSQPPWKCPQCGEVLEAQFDSCWRCGSHRGDEIG